MLGLVQIPNPRSARSQYKASTKRLQSVYRVPTECLQSVYRVPPDKTAKSSSSILDERMKSSIAQSCS